MNTDSAKHINVQPAVMPRTMGDDFVELFQDDSTPSVVNDIATTPILEPLSVEKRKCGKDKKRRKKWKHCKNKNCNNKNCTEGFKRIWCKKAGEWEEQ